MSAFAPMTSVKVPGLSTKILKAVKTPEPATDQMVQDCQDQIATLLSQVDDLQVQLMHQSQQQVLIQADCQLQLSLMRDKLAEVSRHAEACHASAQVTYSHLSSLSLALPAHQAQTLAAITGLAQQMVRDSDQLLDTCTADVLFQSPAQSPGLTNSPLSLKASDQSATISWLHEQLLLSQERELDLKQQVAEAHRVFVALEREVATLHQHQVVAADQLKASKKDTDDARAALQSAIDALRRSTARDSDVDDAYTMVEQGLSCLDAHAAALDDVLYQVESAQPSASKPAGGRGPLLAAPVDASALRASLASAAAPLTDHTHVTVSASRTGPLALRQAVHRSMQQQAGAGVGGVWQGDISSPRDQTPRTTGSRRVTRDNTMRASVDYSDHDAYSPVRVPRAAGTWVSAGVSPTGHQPIVSEVQVVLGPSRSGQHARRSSSAPASPRQEHRDDEFGVRRSDGLKGKYQRPGRHLLQSSDGGAGGGRAAIQALANQITEAVLRGVGPVRPPGTDGVTTMTQTGRSVAGAANPEMETQTGHSLAGADPAVLAATGNLRGPAAHMAAVAQAAEAMRKRTERFVQEEAERERQRELQKLRDALAAEHAWREAQLDAAAARSEELSGAMQQIEQLQQQAEAQCVRSEQQEVALVQLQADLRQAKDAVGRAKQDAEVAAQQAQRTQRALEAKCEALEDHNESLHGQVQQLLVVRQQLEQRVGELEAACGELEQLRDKWERDGAVHLEMREELGQTQLELAQAHAKVIDLENVCEEHKEVVRLRGAELLDMTQQLAADQAKLAECEAELQELRGQLQQLQAELEQSRSDAAEQVLELECARKQVISGAVELVDIRDRLAANDQEMVSLRQQHEVMAGQVAAAKELAAQHSAGVKALQDQLASAHEKIAAQATQLMAANHESRTQAADIATLQCKLDTSTSELQATREQLKLAHQQAAVQLAEQLQTIKQLDSALADVDELRSRSVAAEQQLVSERKLAAEQAAELKQLTEEVIQQRRTLSDLQSLCETTSAELQTSRGQLLDTHEQSAAQALEMRQVQEQLAAKDTQVQRLRDEADAIAAELGLVQQRLAESQEHAAVQAKDAKFLAEQVALHSAEAAECRTKLDATAAALQAREHKLASATAQCATQETELQQLTAQLTTAQQQLEDSSSRVVSLESQVESQAEDLVLVRGHSERLEQQLSSCKEQLEAAEGRLKAQAAKLEAAQSQLETRETTLVLTQADLAVTRNRAAEAEQLRELQTQQAAELSALQAKLDATTSELQAVQLQYHSLQQRATEQSEEMQRITSHMGGHAAELGKLRVQYDRVTGELDASRALLQASEREAGSLRQQLEAKDSELLRITEDLRRAEAQAADTARDAVLVREQLVARTEDVLITQAASQTELDEWRVRVAEYEQAVEVLHSERGQLEEELQLAVDSLSSAQADLQLSLAVRSQLEQALAAAEAQLQSGLAAAAGAQQAAVAEARQQELLLQEELAQLKVHLLAAQTEAADRTAEVQHMQEQLQQGQREMSALRDALDVQAQELRYGVNMGSVGSELADQLQAQLAAREADLGAVNQHAISLQQQLESVQAVNGVLAVQVEELQSKLAELQSSAETEEAVRVQLLESLGEIAALRQEIKQLGRRATTGLSALQAQVDSRSTPATSCRTTRTLDMLWDGESMDTDGDGMEQGVVLKRVARVELQAVAQECQEQASNAQGLHDKVRMLQVQFDQSSRRRTTQQLGGEVKAVLKSEMLPLLAEVEQLTAQAARLVAAQAELKAALASAVAVGEAAAEQLEQHRAAAVQSRNELIRARSTYHESQRTLHALHEEAQRLNQQLWQQNSQLADERDRLAAQLQQLRPGSRAMSERGLQAPEHSYALMVAVADQPVTALAATSVDLPSVEVSAPPPAPPAVADTDTDTAVEGDTLGALTTRPPTLSAPRVSDASSVKSLDAAPGKAASGVHRNSSRESSMAGRSASSSAGGVSARSALSSAGGMSGASVAARSAAPSAGGLLGGPTPGSRSMSSAWASARSVMSSLGGLSSASDGSSLAPTASVYVPEAELLATRLQPELPLPTLADFVPGDCNTAAEVAPELQPGGHDVASALADVLLVPASPRSTRSSSDPTKADEAPLVVVGSIANTSTGSSLAGSGPGSDPAVQLRAGLAASQRQVQTLQGLLFERNQVIHELEGQLVDLSDDIKTFEDMVVRVESLTASMSRSRGSASTRDSV